MSELSIGVEAARPFHRRNIHGRRAENEAGISGKILPAIRIDHLKTLI